MNEIAELELNIEWCPKILWVTGHGVEPVGIKRDGMTNVECLERAVNEYLARSLNAAA